MSGTTPNPWVQREYPQGGAQLDRVIFFSDAVFAIALTLAAVRIEVPAVTDGNSSDALWSALTDKGPALLAFAITFFWVGFYWRANHKFTATLRAMDGSYIAAMLVYLAFVALLPWPSSVLGEYTDNPVAVAFFAVVAASWFVGRRLDDPTSPTRTGTA